MTILLLSFAMFLLAMSGMAIGVIAGRGSLRGTCGGLNLPDGSRISCGGCKAKEQCPRRAESGPDGNSTVMEATDND